MLSERELDKVIMEMDWWPVKVATTIWSIMFGIFWWWIITTMVL